MDPESTLTSPRDRPSSARKANPWVLTLLHRPGSERHTVREVLVEGEAQVLGRRAPTFEGAMNDPQLSRTHAEVALRNGVVHLRDLGSRNGTRVNGEHVIELSLTEGDVITLGQTLILVHRVPRCFDVPECPDTVAASAAMAEVLVHAAVIASRDAPVLVLGETGVGKEVVARELHRRSGRTGRYVAVNCGALSDNLLQSELFGHKRGAFSGASEARSGLVKEAEGGTLLLDEIGEASATLQVSLLRLLQEKEYRPVGSDRTVKADVRVIAATLQDLDAGVAEGRFRQDLYMRLSTWTLRVPPLRSRREEILPLAYHFARKRGRPDVEFCSELAEALLLYDWPGNARELDGMVERLVGTAGHDHPIPAPTWLDDALVGPAARGGARETPDAASSSPTGRAPGARLSAEELRRGMKDFRGNIKAYAASLGIGRNTLYRWLRGAGIEPNMER